jgi:hypothetical protein
MTSMNIEEIVEVVIRNREGRNAFPFPDGFALYVASKAKVAPESRLVDLIDSEIERMEATLNGLCADGAAI